MRIYNLKWPIYLFFLQWSLKKTFMGRFYHNMDIIDPRTLFVSKVSLIYDCFCYLKSDINELIFRPNWTNP